MDKSGESGNVSRVEDNYNMLYVRAILLDIVTELSGDLAVAREFDTCKIQFLMQKVL